MYIISLGYDRMFRIFKSSLVVPFFVILALFAQLPGANASENSCEEILKSLTTISFRLVYEDVGRHEALAQLRDIFQQRDPETQKRIDDQLIADHAAKEMSFQVRNPKTQMYDKFVAVPANGFVAPIRKQDYDRMVKSTGPVLRALRTLLQKAYSQREWSSESLGLEALPQAEAATVLKVLRESIYMEPSMRDSSMHEYPFLTVSGFDGAIVDPRKPQNVFFEMNLGTPSGISNNAELLESLAQRDPELAEVLKYRPNDNTFELLARAIRESAEKWTQKMGISVVISPGVYNGAHPDVAAIAKYSGMPLVKPSDLYEDEDGMIRLNAGQGKRDPMVTGIYNRMEESYLLQNSEEGIPLINPLYEDLSDLRRKTGLPLRNGAVYKWIYGANNEIVDVERGSGGEPLLQDVWETMGADPLRPGVPAGSFSRAILGRKLYVSNVGGRLVDDKRLFRIVSEYLAKPIPGLATASPVKGLAPANFAPLYAEPAKFVVKAPANSGGVGIYFPRTMEPNDVAELLAGVRANPADYEVQYLSPIALLPKSNGATYDDVAIDLRIFVMMDPQGNVNAGPNSILLRTAPPGGLYSNTSRGGGYGVGLVLDTKTGGHFRRSVPAVSVVPQSAKDLAFKTMTDLKQLLKDMNRADDDELSTLDAEFKARASDISLSLRGLLPYLNAEFAKLPQLLREYSQGEEFLIWRARHMLRQIERSFFSDQNQTTLIGAAVRTLAVGDQYWWAAIMRSNSDPTSTAASPLNGLITYRKLDQPYVSNDWIKDGSLFLKKEIAEIVSVKDPVVQGMIDFVRANGGEVRLLKTEEVTNDESRRSLRLWGESPYFWVNLRPGTESYLKPVIGIDLTSSRAISALAHEIEHFKIWIDVNNHFLSQGMDPHDAAVATGKKTWERDMIIFGEKRALEAEMAADRKYRGHLFNSTMGIVRPSVFWQRNYVNRLVYPEFEAVRETLREHVIRGLPLDIAAVRKYMTAMVITALETREKALKHLESRSNTELEEFWRSTSILDMLIKPFGSERLKIDGTEALFKEHLRAVCEQRTRDPDCGLIPAL